MKRIILLILAGVVMAEAGAAASPEVLLLPPLIDQALSNNPSLKAKRSEWEAMRERVPQARAWEDARLGVQATAGRFVDIAANSFTDQRFALEQALPLGGRNRLRGDAAVAEALSAWARWQRLELDVILRTRVAYFRLADAYAQLDLNRRNAALWKQLSESSRDKYRAGTRSEADVLSAETEWAKLEEAGADYQRTIDQAQIELNGLMDRPGLTPLGRPVPPAFHPRAFSLATVEGLALAHRPELLMAEQKIVAAQAQLAAAQRGWIPDPSVRIEADRYNGNSQPISEVDVGLSVGLPWFNRAKYRAAIRETKSLLATAQSESEAARREALTEVETQVVKIETFHHHAELFHSKLVPLSEQTFTARLLGYQTDKAGFLDLLTAQREQQEMESMYWDHCTDYQIAVVELESIVGVDPSGNAPPGHQH